MNRLARLLNPTPPQDGIHAASVTSEASARDNEHDPIPSNKYFSLSGTTSPKEPTSSNEPASPNEAAPSKKAASPVNSDQSENITLTDVQPDTSNSKQLIHHNGQAWEYIGYEWVEEGILSLKLKPVGSDSGPEFIREIDVQRDSPKDLLRLWRATPRPKSKKYELLRVLWVTKNGCGRVQWTVSTMRQRTLRRSRCGKSVNVGRACWKTTNEGEQISKKIAQLRYPSESRLPRSRNPFVHGAERSNGGSGASLTARPFARRHCPQASDNIREHW